VHRTHGEGVHGIFGVFTPGDLTLRSRFLHDLAVWVIELIETNKVREHLGMPGFSTD